MFSYLFLSGMTTKKNIYMCLTNRLSFPLTYLLEGVKCGKKDCPSTPGWLGAASLYRASNSVMKQEQVFINIQNGGRN